MNAPLLRLLTADTVYTGMGLPVSEGGVVISEGGIVATGKASGLRGTYPQAAESRAGRVIAPPPVNAHAHLDMTLYPFRAAPFHEWLPWVVSLMFGQPQLRGARGALQGLKLLRASNVASVGDIVARAEVMPLLLSAEGLAGVAYWEVLDPNPASARETLAKARGLVREWRQRERPGGMRIGISPHATYTVSHTLMRELVAWAAGEGLPLQIHVAESPAELELFQTGGGGLTGSLARNGLTFEEAFGRSPDPELTPLRYLADLGVLDAKPTLVHMVHVSEDDVRAVAQAGCGVVTCPRSNQNLSCGTFDWPLFARYGVEVGLGTDSVASGGSLNIHDEIAAARAIHPNIDERTLVRAAVKGGARALGEKVPFLRRGEPWREEYVWPEVAQPDFEAESSGNS